MKIDRTPPTLSVDGQLRTLADDDSGQDLFGLDITAQDGDPSGAPTAQRSGVGEVRILVDGVVAYEKTQSADCAGDSCPLAVGVDDWSLDTDRYAEGTHQVRVEAYDRAGNSPATEQWTISIGRESLFARRLDSWRHDVEQRADASSPLPLSGPMPEPPAAWRTPETCSQSAADLQHCYDLGHAWGGAVRTWLVNNLTLGTSASTLPSPPAFPYARNEVARDTVQSLIGDFEVARTAVVSPTAPLKVAVGLVDPVDAQSAARLLPDLQVSTQVALRGVFEPSGAGLSGAWESPDIVTSLQSSVNAFYSDQESQAVAERDAVDLELATQPQELDSDDVDALNSLRDGLTRAQARLAAKGSYVTGIAIQTSVRQVLALLDQATPVIGSLRVLPSAASVTRDGGDALDDMRAVAASASSGPSGSARAAPRSQIPTTCNDDGVRPGSYMPNRFLHLNSNVTSNGEKLHVMLFGWFAPGGLAFYCGDDPGDRGFEPEAKVYPQQPRWSTDWPKGVDANDRAGGYFTNLPAARFDDLNKGGLSSHAYDTQEYPDFSIITTNGRALNYRKYYFSRFRTNKGETNAGTVNYRAQSTTNADRRSYRTYCISEGGRAASCKFAKDTTCLAYRALSDGVARRKIDWYQDGRDQPFCQPAS